MSTQKPMQLLPRDVISLIIGWIFSPRDICSLLQVSICWHEYTRQYTRRLISGSKKYIPSSWLISFCHLEQVDLPIHLEEDQHLSALSTIDHLFIDIKDLRPIFESYSGKVSFGYITFGSDKAYHAMIELSQDRLILRDRFNRNYNRLIEMFCRSRVVAYEIGPIPSSIKEYTYIQTEWTQNPFRDNTYLHYGLQCEKFTILPSHNFNFIEYSNGCWFSIQSPTEVFSKLRTLHIPMRIESIRTYGHLFPNLKSVWINLSGLGVETSSKELNHNQHLLPEKVGLYIRKEKQFNRLISLLQLGNRHIFHLSRIYLKSRYDQAVNL